MKLRSLLLGLLVAGFSWPGISHASSLIVSQSLGSTSTITSVNIATSSSKVLFHGIAGSTMKMGGNRLVYSKVGAKGYDLYSRNVTTNTEKRIVTFTDCVGDPDPGSCMIYADGVQPSGARALYNYKGTFLYQFSTGLRTKLNRYYSGFSPSGASVMYAGPKSDGSSVYGFRFQKIGSSTSQFIPFPSDIVNNGNYSISPNDTSLLWPTGGSTNAETGVTQPTTLHLASLATGKKLSTLRFMGSFFRQIWLTPTSFINISVQQPQSDQPIYAFYRVTITNGKMTAVKFYSSKKASLAEAMKIDLSHIAVIEQTTNTSTVTSISTTGTRRVIRSYDTTKGGYVQLVGVRP